MWQQELPDSALAGLTRLRQLEVLDLQGATSLCGDGFALLKSLASLRVSLSCSKRKSLQFMCSNTVAMECHLQLLSNTTSKLGLVEGGFNYPRLQAIKKGGQVRLAKARRSRDSVGCKAF